MGRKELKKKGKFGKVINIDEAMEYENAHLFREEISFLIEFILSIELFLMWDLTQR